MPTAVFGREAELSAVDAVLASARHGLGALVPERDPGIGRTTVWQQGIAHGIAAGYRVLSCRAVGVMVAVGVTEAAVGVDVRVQSLEGAAPSAPVARIVNPTGADGAAGCRLS